MKRKTKNRILLEIIKRQEKEIAALGQCIKSYQNVEQQRDDAWAKYTDDRIKEINSSIRASNNRHTAITQRAKQILEQHAKN